MINKKLYMFKVYNLAFQHVNIPVNYYHNQLSECILNTSPTFSLMSL